MRKRIAWTLIVVLVLTMTGSVWAQSPTEYDIKGSLVIVGGAMESTSEGIYNKFIELAGGKDEAKIAIIPAASGSPSKYANEFKKDLMAYGVKESHIEIIPIAVKDEKKTADVDESTWAGNGSKPEIASQIEKCTGVWFVGGDQTRITQTLFKEDGSNTLALDAIWDVYKEGGVIGGTSAGAAIMSDIMIAGGNSLGALVNGFTTEYTSMNDQEQGPVYLQKGLGFFKHGIVDQHFDRKARLGRLIVTALEKGKKDELAYGVDENTAMIVNNETKMIEVVGAGGVTLVDISKATKDLKSKRTSIKDIVISYIEQGDTFNISTKEFVFNPDKVDTAGYEYYEVNGPILNTGVMSANGYWKQFIAFDLVDNGAVKEVKSYLFDDKGLGFELIFRKTEESNGYWAYLNGGTKDYYSVLKVALDIEPIQVEIKYDDKKK
ncbi:MAG: cyanophycinase [Anaerosolibacter sp.]|uniref:cyanophycinase n=1 Tax=Anaerosolibacter sp. TaxID=1872527 RepID=UPI002607F2F3|nr:cyanophycinase [Anaerosolibacter sp.]MDF2547481.1 cyanophycinase [Anaerosolibacter sp.]